MITICFTYFKSLGLANFGSALYSVRQQNLSHVDSIVIIDNNTEDSRQELQAIVDSLSFPVSVRLLSFKHGDPTKTHTWSTNVAVREATTPWVLFTRADYLLSFDAVDHFVAAATGDNQFIVGGYYDVHVDIGACETTNWRLKGPSVLPGREYDHVMIDSGVWMTRREVFDRVGGLDELLTAWGHAQTHFQHKLFLAGVEFVRIPHVVFYHPRHAHLVERDMDLASQQVQQITGFSVKDMWARYVGPDNPY